jgi:hypothetical protein
MVVVCGRKGYYETNQLANNPATRQVGGFSLRCIMLVGRGCDIRSMDLFSMFTESAGTGPLSSSAAHGHRSQSGGHVG